MSNTYSFAEREFDVLDRSWDKSNPDTEPVVLEFREEILALCEKFGNSGQSGGSAPYVASAIAECVKKLCLQQPICPITGIDGEWYNCAGMGATDIDSSQVWQNSRCSALFKDGNIQNGRPYYLDAITWKESDIDAAFSGTVDGIPSRQFVKSFPFTPKTFYLETYRELYNPQIHGEDAHVIQCGDGDYVYFIKDKEKQLERVWKYYDRFIWE